MTSICMHYNNLMKENLVDKLIPLEKRAFHYRYQILGTIAVISGLYTLLALF